jgi:hypothetical protein
VCFVCLLRRRAGECESSIMLSEGKEAVRDAARFSRDLRRVLHASMCYVLGSHVGG